MAKTKLDAQQLKQLFWDYGERVALGLAIAVTLFFLVLSVLVSLRTRAHDQEILRAAQQLASRIQDTGEGLPDIPAPTAPTWARLEHPQDLENQPWLWSSSAANTQRRNPEVLPVGEVKKEERGQLRVVGGVSLKYYQGPVFTYVLGQQGLEVFTKNAPPRMQLAPGAGGLMPGPAALPGGAAPPVGSGVFGGGINPQAGSGATGPMVGGLTSGLEPVRDIQPSRVVVLMATFPYRQQLELFRRALRFKDLSELFQQGREPKFLGLVVWRAEVTGADPSKWKWVPLYLNNPKVQDAVRIGNKLVPVFDRATVSEQATRTRELLLSSIYEEEQTLFLAQQGLLLDGLATPLPQLAIGHYDWPTFAGIKPPAKDKQIVQEKAGFPGAEMPALPGVSLPGVTPGGPAASAEPEVQMLPWNKLPAELARPIRLRFSKKGPRVFNPLGLSALQLAQMTAGAAPLATPETTNPPVQENNMKKEEDDEEGAPMTPRLPRPNADQNGAYPGIPEKVLVRFFDADIQPGKTYYYALALRVANPNYGDTERVLYKELADIKELVSPTVVVGPITIPPEWDFYVVDEKTLQHNWHPVSKGASDTLPLSPGLIAVQVHKWFEYAAGRTVPLGDWQILERLLLRRGEEVRRTVSAQVPRWNKTKDKFELLSLKHSPRNDAGGLDFSPPAGARPPRLVDFVWGHNQDYRLGSKLLRDDSAAEALFLGADGRLFVRREREDSDAETPRGRLRLERHENWRQRLADLEPRKGPARGPQGR
jgi:hypothetical protein